MQWIDGLCRDSMVRVSVLAERDTHTRRDGQTDRDRESMIRVSVVVVAQRERERQCSMQWMDGLCRDSMTRVNVPAERETHTQTDKQTDRQTEHG